MWICNASEFVQSLLQFETLLSGSANYAPLSAAVVQTSTFRCCRRGEYSVPRMHMNHINP